MDYIPDEIDLDAASLICCMSLLAMKENQKMHTISRGIVS